MMPIIAGRETANVARLDRSGAGKALGYAFYAEQHGQSPLFWEVLQRQRDSQVTKA